MSGMTHIPDHLCSWNNNDVYWCIIYGNVNAADYTVNMWLNLINKFEHSSLFFFCIFENSFLIYSHLFPINKRSTSKLSCIPTALSALNHLWWHPCCYSVCVNDSLFARLGCVLTAVTVHESIWPRWNEEGRRMTGSFHTKMASGWVLAKKKLKIYFVRSQEQVRVTLKQYMAFILWSMQHLVLTGYYLLKTWPIYSSASPLSKVWKSMRLPYVNFLVCQCGFYCK